MKNRIFKLRTMAMIIASFAVAVMFVSCRQGSNTDVTEPDTEVTEPETESSTEAQITITEKPEEVALKFINSYVGDLPADMVEWVSSNDLATVGFKTAVKTMVDQAFELEPEYGLGFDPIIDGQDFPDEGFELESFDDNTNFMVVKGINWPDFKVTVKMVLENNNWLVDGCGVVNIPEDKQSSR